jgi:hypothetical protein
MKSQPERPVVAEGKSCKVECAMTVNERFPAEEFLDQLSAKEQQHLQVSFQQVADQGRSSRLKHRRGRFHGFACGATIRIACFQIGRIWRLTHGFVKKTRKWKEREFDTANRIMKEDSAHERDN